MPTTQSQLYGELAYLAATGLVQASHPGPRGRKELVFFLWTLPPQAARAYLGRVATRSRAFHQRLRDLQASLDNTLAWPPPSRSTAAWSAAAAWFSSTACACQQRRPTGPTARPSSSTQTALQILLPDPSLDNQQTHHR
jgi:hypothetical protein